MKKILFLTMLLCISIITVNAQMLKTDFFTGYSINDQIENGEYIDSSTPNMLNQWNLGLEEKDGTNPLAVAPLSYSGYINSGIDVAMSLLDNVGSGSRNTVYSLSGSDADYPAGTYYLAFLLNVSKAITSSGAEFIAFDTNQRGQTFRSRVAVKNAGDNKFYLGINGTKSLTTITWDETKSYNLDETHLIVVKLVVNTFGSEIENGTCALFVNPAIDGIEPVTPAISTTLSFLSRIRGISVRQRGSFEAHLGGLAFSNSWSSLFDPATVVTDNISDNGKVISTQYFNIDGNEIYTPLNSGVYVERTIYENGTTKARKVIRKQ